MIKRSDKGEWHASDRVGWLRAAVLGANDGIVSTASLIVGVAAAAADKHQILIAGFSGLAGGAMSMAAGEYVSVSSQSDAEKADLAREARELRELPKAEHRELAEIYEGRGLSPELARQVADQLMAKDALGSHARDELGISEATRPRPIQAAIASAAAFSVGAILPLLTAAAVPLGWTGQIVALASLVFLALLGAASALTGGVKLFDPIFRVTLWGAIAMGVTAGLGRLFGVAIS